MKRIICAILLLVLVFCLAACGEADPNCGVYVADKATYMGVTVDVTTIFKGGMTLELKNGGRAVLSYGDESGNLKWTLDGDQFSAKDSEGEVTGTLADGEITLVNIMDSGVDIHLVKQDTAE